MRPVGNALAQTTFQQAGERPEVKVPQSTLIPRHHTRDDHHGNVHGLRSDVLWIHDIGGAAVPSTGNHGNQKAKLETGTRVESGVIFRAPPRRRPLARHIAEQGETPASFPIASLALSNVLSIFSEAGQLSQSRFLPAFSQRCTVPSTSFPSIVNWGEEGQDMKTTTMTMTAPDVRNLDQKKKGRRQSSNHAIFTKGPSILSKPGCITSQSAGRPRDKHGGDCVSTPEPNELAMSCRRDVA